MRCAPLVAAAGFFLLIGTPAFAFDYGLTDSDYDYLATQNFARDNSVLKSLSPKEQARLHTVINDATTGHDDAARSRNVAEAMAIFAYHQQWEAIHPPQPLHPSKP
jgi:hypothetical protein